MAKALGSDGSGSDTLVADAVDWCVENGADVIHSRWVELPTSFRSPSVQDELQAMRPTMPSMLACRCAAAGNDGEDDDGDVPTLKRSRCDFRGGVTIKGTTGPVLQRAITTAAPPAPHLDAERGPEQEPEVVAPAEGVPVLTEDGGWGIADGTSAATVYVTGALCLLLEEKPELKPEASNGADTVDTSSVGSWTVLYLKKDKPLTTITMATVCSTCPGLLISPLRHEEAKPPASRRTAA